ncbi:hypothetical protein VNO77_09063 [Canavalia gladiata]|uniref:Uncharacterized protein n=1 Tax=Canavalia gladiata TaxID=3824 RepID=A0AAN9MEF1_CANGL
MYTLCGLAKHAVEICYNKLGFPHSFKFQNSSNSTMNSAISEDDNIAQVAERNFFPPTNQHEVLSKLIVQININTLHSKINSWILDTVATDYVTYSISNVVTFHAIRPVQVKTPNGSSVIATHSAISILFCIFLNSTSI